MGKRMDKIEESLTPEQAVIAFLEEANQFESIREYAVWLGERLKDPTKFRTLAIRVGNGIRQRMQGEPEQKVKKVARAGIFKTAFLEFLQLQVNSYFFSEWRAIELEGQLLLERACATLRDVISGDLSTLGDDKRRENLTSHAIELFTLKAAAEEVAKRYFDNHQVLRKCFSKQVDKSIERIFQIMDVSKSALYVTYRRHHGGKDPRDQDCRLEFDLESVRRSIDPKELVKSMVDWAHADALAWMGKSEEALRLVVSMVDPVMARMGVS